MHDRRPPLPRGHRASESRNQRQPDPRSVLPTLPLGGAAFSPPLSSATLDSTARRNRRAALTLVMLAALLSIAAVAIALVVRAGRSQPEHRSRIPGLAAGSMSTAPLLSAGPVARPPATPAGRSGPQHSGALAAPSELAMASTADSNGRSSDVGQPQAQQGPRAAPVRSQTARRDGDAVGRTNSRASRRELRRLDRSSDLPARPSRAQVIAALQRVAPAVSACFGRRHGTAKVLLSVIGKTGRVTTARVSGQPGRVGSCIARAVRRARLPEFRQRKLEISYPFAH